MPDNYHLLTSIMYLPAIAGISILGFMLLVQRRTASHIAFSAFSFTLALWLLPQYLAQLLPTAEGYTLPLQLLQLDSAIANFFALSFLIFVLRYAGLWKRYRRLVWVASGFATLFATLSFTPLMISEVESSWNGIVIKEAGLLYSVQILLLVVLFVSGMVSLFNGTIKMPRHLRSSNYLLIIAIAQAVVVSVCASVFFASSIVAQIMLPLSLFVMVAVIGFAIVRHRLFDIHLIVARTLGYVLSLCVLGGAFIAAGVLIGHIFFTDIHIPQSATITYSILALLMAFSFQPIKKRFDKVSNRLFYRDAYDAQDFYNELNEILVSTLDLDKLVSQTSSLIVTHIKTGFCLIALRDGLNGRLRIVGDAGQLTDRDMDIIRRSSSMHASAQRTIVTDFFDGPDQELTHVLNKNNIAILARLGSVGSGEAIGYILIGQKKSGNLYNRQDVRVVEAIANELVIAIQNAMRFEEIEAFNRTLQEKVEEATKKLRRTNERLRVLDQTKDDFISMASHQLRTPLTSVKGYVSMVLDGDAGRITAVQRKLLNQSFISSQRMVYLISDLLNVSRLRTGKFIIENAPINLAKVIEEEVGQLLETVKGRNLELNYHKPEHFPLLMLDETKIRQVLMNFIDNAVYYTPSGGHIDIYLEEKPQSIEFRVVDDGIGVPRHEQHHLFTKFYRAHNAKRARPDGTGLGIFMAKKVIIAQGGAVIFKSQEGKGSTFGFTFPKHSVLAPEKTSGKGQVKKEMQKIAVKKT